MKESPFGFEYTWEDLKPVRGLFVTVLVFQVFGSVLALFLLDNPSWFNNIWSGAAFATFPGYLFGLLVQEKQKEGSLSKNLIMVRRLGMVAFILTLAAFFMPFE